MLANAYGQFSPDGRAFTISDPRTPMPWVNVICTGRYGLVVSQRGGGFSWFDDAQHNVLTRWEMDLVRDQHGKFLYLVDGDDQRLWSLAPTPCSPAYDAFSCTHTQGSTTFESSLHGIDATWELGVAFDAPIEIWLVTLTNRSERTRTLKLASYFEWTCGVAPDSKREFHRLFFNTSSDASRQAIFATKNMWDIRPKSEREHWNKPWPYVAAHSVGGDLTPASIVAIGDKSTFLGRYGDTTRPAALLSQPTEKSIASSFGRFGDAVASLGGTVKLKPGESARVFFTITIGNKHAEAAAHIDAIRTFDAAAGSLHAAKQRWRELLSPTQVSTERDDFNLLNQHWLPYQAISGRLWGRTGYYQQSGAFGFRDQLQDSQVWLPLDPAGTVKQIMLHAERQFADGSVYHWWHALADFGNHTACSDDYLWLPFLVASYIRETGDATILDRVAPFVDDATPTSIVEHCRRSIARAFARTSSRGIPLIGSCDWNDGLSAMGIEGKGESVWLGMFLCGILDDWAEILSRYASAAPALRDRAGEYRQKRMEYAAAIEAVAWDPVGYYRYGTRDDGKWVGASECVEGKMHLNAQTWAILTELAPPARAASAWDAVKKHLLTPFGPLLVDPAYTVPDADIGYITRYSPGSRENGGVYMHAATWCLAAACKRRDADTVERIWNSISPAWRGRDADAYVAEPYVTPGNVDGPLSDKPGRAGWTWYTGSAAWLNRVSLEWVLGIRPTWEGLLVDPCPPASLGKVDVTRTWRGRRIRVRFDAAEYDPKATPAIVLNGEALADNQIRPEQLGASSEVDVVVRWGSPGATEPEPTVVVSKQPAIKQASPKQQPHRQQV
ncbi:MAG: glycosyl transferase family 36 [Planctomycetota bacterium]|nr:glycosyl transferase family 36 [Planctomycetota bacterium]